MYDLDFRSVPKADIDVGHRLCRIRLSKNQRLDSSDSSNKTNYKEKADESDES